ncbi:hypothetical protein EPO33_01870 [Patescibacteria group bacterium]|nr:MAG: hypothetical protein EPO33_01870 [Patescibacteria group bacterium]
MNQEETIKTIRTDVSELQVDVREIRKDTSEIRRQVGRLYDLADGHEDRLKWLEENVFTKEDQRKMMNALDFLVGQFKLLDEEWFAATEWLKRHESRIERLETHTGLA